jgi:hypothetical protein
MDCSSIEKSLERARAALSSMEEIVVWSSWLVEGAVMQVSTFGGRNSSVVGGPGVVRPVQITRVLDGLFLDREVLEERASGTVIDGAPGASGWVEFQTRTQVLK